jgi:hypothetical protein
MRRPLGTFVHARSGDKGGDANLGLWVTHDGVSTSSTAEGAREGVSTSSTAEGAHEGVSTSSTAEALYDARVAWLLTLVTPEFVRELLPETATLDVETFPLPNLGGVNVVVHDLLGRGVAASTRFDPQAKGLGEWARARYVDIPEELL